MYPSSIACTSEPPSAASYCTGTTWVVDGAILPTVITISGPVVITGNVTLLPNSTLVIIDGNTVPIVQGTTVLSGTLNITLATEPLDGRTVQVLTGSNGISGSFSSINVASPRSKNCTDISGTAQVQGSTLAVLISVSDRRCGSNKSQLERHKTAIIAGSAVGGVVLLAVVAIVALLAFQRRRILPCIFSETKKSEQAWVIR